MLTKYCVILYDCIQLHSSLAGLGGGNNVQSHIERCTMPVYYIISTVCGFLTGWVFDLPRVARSGRLRAAMGFVHMALLTVGFIGLASSPSRLEVVPSWISKPAWVSTVTFLLLFIYTVFIEISVRSWFLGVGKNQLVTSGSYAMCRHPGTIWVIGMMVSLTLATRSVWLFLTLPLWITLDLLWVWIQERFCFPRLFAGYDRYKLEVPAFLPNRQSLKRAIATFLPKARGVE